MSKWTHPIPIWVSRKNADEVISQFTVSLWMFMLLGVLILLNLLSWSIIGLVEVVQYIF
jgi:hypothetical protein